jgi:hypothetical protein
MARCYACNIKDVDYKLDDEFCPDCYHSYVENLESISPEAEKEKINSYIKNVTKVNKDDSN